ncbi:MAG: PKD domain-containing protein, partial [Flavobacteriales bacterium]|nr:PKD domain-containing protein [Flavobacteriales bacterium]
SSISSIDESCPGLCDGSATVVPLEGTTPYTYTWDDPNTQGTPTAGGLCAGLYNVTATDLNGCFTSSSVSVASPPLLVAAISSSINVSCFGYCNGSAQSTVSGGTPPYSYLWADGQTADQALGLCAGVYALTVTDANNCTATTSVTITEPQGMALTTTMNDVTCFNACDGNAMASLSGGTPPFTYLWNDIALQSTVMASNLCNGIYAVSVTDNMGCTQTANVVISQPQQLGFASTITSSTCGFNNGGACLNVIGGIAPFIIQWDDPATTLGACANNLFAGVYNPIVSDGNGCFFTMPVIVNDLTGPTIDSIVSTDITCSGDSNGTATVTASGSSPPLTYFWKTGSDTIGVNLTTVFGLWGGTYTITVVDANGCIAGVSVTVSEPAAVASAIISNNAASCFGVCDGSASVIAGGGTIPYAYLWTDGQITTAATGLCAGLHNVVIADANGCTTVSQVTITEPPQLLIADTMNPVLCAGGADGSIYLTVSGGTPFYSYGWTPNVATGQIATNLSVQTYLVSVTDINGCNAVKPIVVTEPAQITASGLGMASTCGYYNGTAIVTPNGGTPPYSFLWDDPSATTTDTVTGLLARDPYYVIITDANGCSYTHQITVWDAPGPVIDLIATVDVACFGETTGSATVTYNEGTAPLTFEWNDPANQTAITAGNLAAGPIMITITDYNGCTDNGFATINEPPELELFVSDTAFLCYGQVANLTATANGGTQPYNFSWDNGLGSSQNQVVAPLVTTIYNVGVTDANSCPVVTAAIAVMVSPKLQPVPNNANICTGEDAIVGVDVTGGNGGPYSYIWSDGFTGSQQTLVGLVNPLTSFSVTISDGCSPDSIVDITVTVHPKPSMSFTVDGSGCAPSVFTADTASNPTVPIVSWLWYFGDGATSTDANTTTHEYTTADTFTVSLVVISDQGCKDSTAMPGAAVVFENPVADFLIMQNGTELIPPVTSILSPTIDFVDSSSSGVTIWSWDFGDPNSGTDNTSDLQNASHMYTDTGTYTVTLVVEAPNGCTATITKEVRIESEYILFAPNSFTPNGDGDNDSFFPKGVGVEDQSFQLFIFDRWGDLIATVEGEWSDDISIGWNGRANGGSNEAQMDVYVWLIRTSDVLGGDHEYIGHVTLLR